MREAAQPQAVVLPQRPVFLQEALLGHGAHEGAGGKPEGSRCEAGTLAGGPGVIVTMAVSTAECLFCRIVSRTVPADVTGEAEGFVAIKDIHPQAPTHFLIIPTVHIPTLADVSDTQAPLLGRALQFANRLAQEARLTDGGYRVVINCGAGAGQSVWHLHMHLLGGRPLRWPPG